MVTAKNKPTVKILVVYHKRDKLYKNDILVPIHAGRVLAKKSFEEGKLSKKEYNWLIKNTIGDDTGDNISHLNRELNEWTAIYWAWKNYDRLGNPDYIGLNHYRRFLTLPLLYKPLFGSFIEKKGYNKKNLNLILQKYDFLHTRLDEKFLCSGHTFEPWQLGANLSEDYHPLLYKEYQKFLKVKNFYHLNMFILSREDFFNMCEECFPVAEDFLKKAGPELGKKIMEVNYKIWGFDKPMITMIERVYRENNGWYTRSTGYMMEYLTSFYLSYLKEHKKDLCSTFDNINENRSIEYFMNCTLAEKIQTIKAAYKKISVILKCI